MFTQSLGTNTNKCNGCKKRCVISAFYYTKKETGYFPTIDNKIKTHYTDKQGNKHQLRLYNTPRDAMNAGRMAMKYCPSFKDIRVPRTDDYNTLEYCIGCSHHCSCSAIKIQGRLLPKIGSKTIRSFINRFNETQKLPVFNDEKDVKTYIKHRICKLCDNYQPQK
jgi:hypothetical protein